MNQKQNKKIKIVLTGGHGATTARAVVEEILKRGKKLSWDVEFIGAKSAFEGRSVPTLESHTLPKLGVTFRQIIAGKLQTKFTLWTIPSLLKIPIGFISAFILLLRIRPKVILSFGGYAAFPVVFVGWLMRIPVIIHEPTAKVGRANKISSPFAKRIALARKTSQQYFPKSKTVIVGNPISAAMQSIAFKTKISKTPTIFITGGSRGSVTINNLVTEIIKNLLENYYVIHQTGYFNHKQVESLKSALPKNLKSKYQVHSLIDPEDMPAVYRQADIVVARSGANTVADCLVSKRPSILIPLPFTFLNEQKENALYAQRFGIAKVLDQENLTGKKLLREINITYKNWERIVGKVRGKISPDLKASELLVDLLEETL